MAEIRTAAAVANLPVAPRASARAETVRSAQAAFFQAALGDAPVPRAATSTTTTRPVSAPAPQRAFDPDAPEPSRLLRPGSLVDLKV